jgi:2'-5' RNA ligase
MPRLFVGTFLTAEGIEKLVDVQKQKHNINETWKRKLRWVNRHKLHITWVFLGDIEEQAIPDVVSDLRTAISSVSLCTKPITLNYDRFELWPNERKARLAVVTPSQISNDVITIGDTIKSCLQKYISKGQIQHEYKDFQPHVTILRFQDNGKSTTRARHPKSTDLDLPVSIFPIAHKITEVHLIESDLNKKENGYSVIETFPI